LKKLESFGKKAFFQHFFTHILRFLPRFLGVGHNNPVTAPHQAKPARG
jgi:hypothetical protein